MKKTFQGRLPVFCLLSAIVLLSLFGFSQSTKSKEYYSLIVHHSNKYQILEMSGPELGYKKLIFITDDISHSQRRRLEKKGDKAERIPIASGFDNTLVFKEIQKIETNGFEMTSFKFNMTSSANQNGYSNQKISYYLFAK